MFWRCTYVLVLQHAVTILECMKSLLILQVIEVKHFLLSLSIYLCILLYLRISLRNLIGGQ